MEEIKKMAALKREYADVILNTSKEAAARILVAERKALRFQQELIASKEDALNTLIRLKQIMDSKVAEALRISSAQRRKIEELEIQLNEAKDTVNDLREELRRVCDELEKMKSDSVHPVGEQGEDGHVLGSLNLDSEDTLLDQTHTDNSSYFVLTTEKIKTGLTHRDLNSEIRRNKEVELFRNGCAQRIWASEQNTLWKQQSSSTRSADVGYEYLDSEPIVIRVGEDLIQTQTFDHTRTESVVCKAQEMNGLTELDVKNSQVLKKFKASAKRLTERDTYFKQCKTGSQSEQNAELQQGIDTQLAYCSKNKASADSADIGTTFDGKSPSKHNHVNNDEISSNMAKHKESDVILTYDKCKDENSCEGIVVPHTVNNGRIIYTFRRKRKRAHSNLHSNEVVAGMRSIGKRRGSQVAQTAFHISNIVRESSRDSYQLMQVARQLISLSEKRW